MTETPQPAAAIGPNDPDAYCAAIAARNGSPLWLVGRSLPPQRRRFFAAAYASMPVIDDFVDTTFLGLSQSERVNARPAALEHLDGWQAGIEQAACGMTTQGETADARVFRALADVLPRADLGTGPWQALGAAMRHDLEERPIEDWAAFHTYCEGATVAPAVIFIYILGCSVEAGTFRWKIDRPPSHYAADIAVFCYLVHILRDLVADSQGDPQLLTIPRATLSTVSLSPAGLQAAIRQGDHTRVAALVQHLAARAQTHRDEAERRIARLAEQIDVARLHQLSALYGAYTALHDRIRRDPTAVVSDPDGLRRLQRAALIRAMPPAQERP